MVYSSHQSGLSQSSIAHTVFERIRPVRGSVRSSMQIQGQPDVAALNHQPQLDRETQRIVSLCLQRDRDSAIVQELRTERELLLKEREAIEKALQSVHRDLEEVERILTVLCLPLMTTCVGGVRRSIAGRDVPTDGKPDRQIDGLRLGVRAAQTRGESCSYSDWMAACRDVSGCA
ncbi:hypothetical protein BC830DRAFT_679764 [Chytriomyces sp. MP71]|nr:hypothetical protein BC830DRAFT_679764 [Chytriomyces sp. MP71]